MKYISFSNMPVHTWHVPAVGVLQFVREDEFSIADEKLCDDGLYTHTLQRSCVTHRLQLFRSET